MEEGAERMGEPAGEEGAAKRCRQLVTRGRCTPEVMAAVAARTSSSLRGGSASQQAVLTGLRGLPSPKWAETRR